MEITDWRLDRLLVPAHVAVAAALDEADARHQRVAQQILDRETHGIAEQAMQAQPVAIRVDLRHAVVMALEMQPVRRDHPLQLVQRRPGNAIAGRAAVGRNPADGVLLVRRWLAVIAERRSRRLLPGQQFGARGIHARQQQAGARAQPQALPKKHASIQQTAAGHRQQVVIQGRIFQGHGVLPTSLVRDDPGGNIFAWIDHDSPSVKVRVATDIFRDGFQVFNGFGQPN